MKLNVNLDLSNLGKAENKSLADEKLTFGKYKGLTLNELLVYDCNYIMWLAKNCTFFELLQETAAKMVEDHGLDTQESWYTEFDMQTYNDLLY